jgi:large subunit ribosomal protein L24
MKSKFSTSWNSSVQPRKQRKYRYNAPLHLRRRFLNANLSKELRKKHGIRSLSLRKGDEVIVKRGSFAKKKGKILELDIQKGRVTIEGMNRKKIDGTKVNVYLNPSNTQIQVLNLDDSRRIKGIKKEEDKKEKKEEMKNDIPEKK